MFSQMFKCIMVMFWFVSLRLKEAVYSASLFCYPQPSCRCCSASLHLCNAISQCRNPSADKSFHCCTQPPSTRLFLLTASQHPHIQVNTSQPPPTHEQKTFRKNNQSRATYTLLQHVASQLCTQLYRISRNQGNSATCN